MACDSAPSDQGAHSEVVLQLRLRSRWFKSICSGWKASTRWTGRGGAGANVGRLPVRPRHVQRRHTRPKRYEDTNHCDSVLCVNRMRLVVRYIQGKSGVGTGTMHANRER